MIPVPGGNAASVVGGEVAEGATHVDANPAALTSLFQYVLPSDPAWVPAVKSDGDSFMRYMCQALAQHGFELSWSREVAARRWSVLSATLGDDEVRTRAAEFRAQEFGDGWWPESSGARFVVGVALHTQLRLREAAADGVLARAFLEPAMALAVTWFTAPPVPGSLPDQLSLAHFPMYRSARQYRKSQPKLGRSGASFGKHRVLRPVMFYLRAGITRLFLASDKDRARMPVLHDQYFVRRPPRPETPGDAASPRVKAPFLNAVYRERSAGFHSFCIAQVRELGVVAVLHSAVVDPECEWSPVHLLSVNPADGAFVALRHRVVAAAMVRQGRPLPDGPAPYFRCYGRYVAAPKWTRDAATLAAEERALALLARAAKRDGAAAPSVLDQSERGRAMLFAAVVEQSLRGAVRFSSSSVTRP